MHLTELNHVVNEIKSPIVTALFRASCHQVDPNSTVVPGSHTPKLQASPGTHLLCELNKLKLTSPNPLPPHWLNWGYRESDREARAFSQPQNGGTWVFYPSSGTHFFAKKNNTRQTQKRGNNTRPFVSTTMKTEITANSKEPAKAAGITTILLTNGRIRLLTLQRSGWQANQT